MSGAQILKILSSLQVAFLLSNEQPCKTTVILGRSNERSLGSKLIRMSDARDQRKPTSNTVTLTVKRRIRLEGAELESYRTIKKQKEEEEAKLRHPLSYGFYIK